MKTKIDLPKLNNDGCAGLTFFSIILFIFTMVIILLSMEKYGVNSDNEVKFVVSELWMPVYWFFLSFFIVSLLILAHISNILINTNSIIRIYIEEYFKSKNEIPPPLPRDDKIVNQYIKAIYENTKK